MNIDKYFTELEINGYEVGCKIEYTYHKARKGAREGGLQLEPDEQASVEVYSVYIALEDNKFHEIELPDVITDDLANKILEEL